MLFYLLSACLLLLGSIISWLAFTFLVVNYSAKPRAIREKALMLPGTNLDQLSLSPSPEKRVDRHITLSPPPPPT